MKTYKPIYFFFLAILGFSCSSNRDGAPELVNEDEVITTVNISLIDPSGQEVVFSNRDLDAEGPNPPIINAPELMENTIYVGTVTLLNETVNPAENVTEEVAEEDDEHQFFFQLIGNAAVTFDYTDMDENGNPLGINFTLTTGDTSTGDLTVVLRHLLDKFGDGVSNGDIGNAGGDTDVQVVFPILVQ